MLTRAQKKYLKKNIRRAPLSKIAANLGVSEEEILNFLKSHWHKEKYQKFLAKQKGSQQCPKYLISKKWFSQNWKVFAFLALLVLAVYFNSLGNDFVSDDIYEIVQNKYLGSFLYIRAAPLYFSRRLLYFLIYKIFNLNPLFFRLLNIIFHAGSVFLVYLLLTLILKPKVALFTASLFAVHPLLSESVAWISGGIYSQYSFFFLLSFLTYLLCQNQRKLYFVSFLSFFLALSSSEKAIVLPLVFFLFDFSFGKLSKNWKKLIPFFALSVFWALFLLSGFGQRVETLETQHYQEQKILNPLVQIPIAIASYLKLIFWPKDLTLYHSEMSFTQAEYFLRLVVLVVFLGIILYSLKRHRQIFFWLSFFLVSLLPTLTPFGISWIVAERYVYLGSLGIFVLTVFIIQKIAIILKNQKISYVVFGILLVLFSVRTILRNADWKNQDTLWLATAKTSPSSPQNHNNLGDLYGRRGDLERAAQEFKRAIELKPNYADAYHNLANTYHQMGKDDLAIENYQKALSFGPHLWQSHQNLAAIYFNQEKYELALEELEKAIKVSPNNANLYTNLGIVYLKLGKKEKAKAALKKTLQLDPQNQKAKQLLLEKEP